MTACRDLCKGHNLRKKTEDVTNSVLFQRVLELGCCCCGCCIIAGDVVLLVRIRLVSLVIDNVFGVLSFLLFPLVDVFRDRKLCVIVSVFFFFSWSRMSFPPISFYL